MERDRKILISSFAVSIAIPVITLVASLVAGAFSSKIMFVVLMMFIMLPIMAAGVYMWTTGKGEWAISGYNTMPNSQKEYYDSELMSKDIGKLLFVIGLVCLVGFSLIFYVPRGTLVMIGTIVLMIVVFVVYAMYWKGGRYLKDPNVRPPSASKEDKKKQYIHIGAGVGVAAVILVIVFMFVGMGSVDATLDDEKLHIDAPMVNRSIYYEDIVDVELRYDMDYGSRIGGFGGTNVSSGNFNNAEFGDYTLAIYNSARSVCIVVEPESGKMMVFNQGSVEETESFYLELLEKLSH